MTTQALATLSTRAACAPSAAMDPAAWSAVRRLLVVRLDNLGDVLMTTPAMRACRASGRHITLLASSAGVALQPHLRMIDDTILYRAPWVQGPDGDEQADLEMVGRLAGGRYDAAIIFTVCTQSALPAALMCRLAGIKLRLAYARETPYGLLTHRLVDREAVQQGMRHEVRRQLDLVASVGYHADDERLEFAAVAGDDSRAAAALHAAGADVTRPYCVLHVGATAASRRWPPQRFGAAAQHIQAATGMTIVWAAGATEQGLLKAAQAACAAPSVVLPPALSLGELGAVIRSASLLVCNNSGPAHLAAACGRPVVVVYAQTNPQHTPWTPHARVVSRAVPCANCLRSSCPVAGHPCMLDIDDQSVADAALALLRECGTRPMEAA